MNKIFTSYLEKIEKSLQQIIPTESNSEWNNLSFGNIPECVNNDHLANLLTPCRNLMDLGGKRWRPLLLILCYELACQSGKKDGNFGGVENPFDGYDVFLFFPTCWKI